MGTIADLTTSIKTRVATTLGADFSELINVTEIEKNAFKGASKRYGLVAQDSSEVDGTLCHLTLDQSFQLTLTNAYYSNSKASDQDKRSKTVELQDLILTVYEDLKKTKAGRPDLVMHTLDLSVASPEFLEDNDVVAIRATFTIKYRKLL